MSETRKESAENGESKQVGSRRVLLWGSIMAVLAVAAPWSLFINSYEYHTHYYFTALLWSGDLGYFRLFSFNHFFDWFLPILCLRLVPVLQMVNYYRGNSTRKRTAFIVLIGDGIFLPGNIVASITSLSFPGSLLIPLPIQLVVGLLILWLAPVPEPTKPWVKQEESRDWWAESKKSMEEEG